MASSHHRHLLRYCSYTPSLAPWVCKQSLPPNLLTCLEVWVWATVCFTRVAGLVPWQGIKENNTWQGRRASHCSEKKPADHSSSSCTSPSPSPVPQKKPAATLPPPIVVLTVLRIWGNTGHLQFYWSSLSFCPSCPHYTKQRDTCTAFWEGSLICCSTEKCEIMS